MHRSMKWFSAAVAGSLPSDANANNYIQMPFVTASAIIAPPYLSNGVWFVEVKASGSTAFTLKSSALQLQRPAWVMPAPGQPGQTPGLTLPIWPRSIPVVPRVKKGANLASFVPDKWFLNLTKSCSALPWASCKDQ